MQGSRNSEWLVFSARDIISVIISMLITVIISISLLVFKITKREEEG